MNNVRVNDFKHYDNVHHWLEYNFVKTVCEECGIGGKEKVLDWANISGLHHRDRADYKVLCRSCHRKFDKGDSCNKGHPLSGDNLISSRRGWRKCRICQNEYYRINYDPAKRREKYHKSLRSSE